MSNSGAVLAEETLAGLASRPDFPGLLDREHRLVLACREDGETRLTVRKVGLELLYGWYLCGFGAAAH